MALCHMGRRQNEDRSATGNDDPIYGTLVAMVSAVLRAASDPRHGPPAPYLKVALFWRHSFAVRGLGKKLQTVLVDGDDHNEAAADAAHSRQWRPEFGPQPNEGRNRANHLAWGCAQSKKGHG